MTVKEMIIRWLQMCCFSLFPLYPSFWERPSILFICGFGYFIAAVCRNTHQLSSCVNTPLTLVTIQALLKTTHKQQSRAKDAYRGSKCSWSKAQVLLEEAVVHSGESEALCWFITLLGLVTEIRTSMFQSDSWPLRFTHPTANTPTVFQTQTHTHLHNHATTGKITLTPTHVRPQKNPWQEHIDRKFHTKRDALSV